MKAACEVGDMAFSLNSEVVESYGVVTAGGVGSGSTLGKKLNMVKGAKNFLDAYAFQISQHRNFQRELDGLTTMAAF